MVTCVLHFSLLKLKNKKKICCKIYQHKKCATFHPYFRKLALLVKQLAKYVSTLTIYSIVVNYINLPVLISIICPKIFQCL